jgi:hypothetical protein
MANGKRVSTLAATQAEVGRRSADGGFAVPYTQFYRNSHLDSLVLSLFVFRGWPGFRFPG